MNFEKFWKKHHPFYTIKGTTSGVEKQKNEYSHTETSQSKFQASNFRPNGTKNPKGDGQKMEK